MTLSTLDNPLNLKDNDDLRVRLLGRSAAHEIWQAAESTLSHCVAVLIEAPKNNQLTRINTDYRLQLTLG